MTHTSAPAKPAQPFDLFASYMRTAVPLAVGWVLTATGWLGIHPTDTQLHGLVVVAIAGAYYAVFRFLEHLAQQLQAPWLRKAAGVLLGWARPPAYPHPDPSDGGVAELARRSRGRP